jgi:transposase
MYIRTTTVKTKNGPLEYVQLAHNHRDPVKGVSKTQVLYNFGRADQVDLEAVRRLIKSLAKLLGPDEEAAVRKQLGEEYGFEFLGSRQFGGTWLLDGMWKRLRIDKTLNRLLSSRNHRTDVERLLFAMTAHRALAPGSKLSMEDWVGREAFVDGLPEVEVHQLYRAMDFLLEASSEIQHDVFFCVANLFNLEVDLIFLDTTSTYFEIEGEDPGEDGLRKWGHGKDHRDDLAQVKIAFAVTRTGIPVRCWVWPGNTSDQDVVEEVKKDLNQWHLGRVVLVQDTGFNSDENRRILQGAGGHYIIGEKMRIGRNGTPAEALTRGGKYRTMPNGLQCKEVIVGGDSEARRRFVVVRNPVEAERDRKKRDDIVAEVQRRLAELSQESEEPHEKAACELRSHKVFGRYVFQDEYGDLYLDEEKIKAEERLDGKYLLSTSDDGLSVDDVVLGYKQLFEIERVFRDLKHLVDIRPVYHRLPDRIRAHVLLCWLAMLMIRVAENETGETWRNMRKDLGDLQIGIHRTADGEVWQTNPLRSAVKQLLDRLKIKPPPRFYAIKPADGSGA